MSHETNSTKRNSLDILLTHKPFEWCDKHHRMELLLNCENVDAIIKEQCG